MRGNIEFCLVVLTVCATVPCALGVSARLPRTSAGFNRTNFKRNIQSSSRASTTSSIPPVLKDDAVDDYTKIRFVYFEEGSENGDGCKNNYRDFDRRYLSSRSMYLRQYSSTKV